MITYKGQQMITVRLMHHAAYQTICKSRRDGDLQPTKRTQNNHELYWIRQQAICRRPQIRRKSDNQAISVRKNIDN